MWAFDNSFRRELPWLGADSVVAVAPEPALLAFNSDLAAELGVSGSEDILALSSGRALSHGAEPFAQAYAGHQFGVFNPTMGDGRALLLGELLAPDGVRRDVALKGSGRTPFSRNGDGKASMGPVLREYLLGEAMHALGVPTTRALAAISTGEPIRRQRWEPGALLVRVAASHLRVGTVEWVRTQHPDRLSELIAYALARHFPQQRTTDRPALTLLTAVIERQARLIAQWMSLGFVHGVMNTDNMTLSGETIDFGPCAWLEAYDPDTAFSSIDTSGRYRFTHQPAIGAWNLARLAEALLPELHAELGHAPSAAPDEAIAVATTAVNAYWPRYDQAWLVAMTAKLGLVDPRADDESLIRDFLELLHADGVDYTLAWRWLSQSLVGDDTLRDQVLDRERFDRWRQRWLVRLNEGDLAAVNARMDAVNPLVVPRNHLVEEALTAAEGGDLAPFQELVTAVQHPWSLPPDARLIEPASRAFTASYVTYCGT